MECDCDTLRISGCSKLSTSHLRIFLQGHERLRVISKEFFHVFNLFVHIVGGTVICVNAVVWYIHCASAQGPGQSERLSRVLSDPGTGGEVVPGVIVAVPTKT